MNAMTLKLYHKPKKLFLLAWQRSLMRRFWPVLLIMFAWWVTQNFGYSINMTQSLPYKFWIIHLKQRPKRNDYVLFKAPIKSGVPQNTTVIKKVVGVANDLITTQSQDFYINGKYIATAKKYSLQGERLKKGAEGQLKPGQYFVWTSHPDSFDSRYEKMGWINQEQVIGVAYSLW